MPGIHYQHQQQTQYFAMPPTPGPLPYLALPSASPAAGQYGASYIPLPSMSCKLNSTLSASAHPQFKFDLTLAAENMFRTGQFPVDALSKPATSPAMPMLIILHPTIAKWQIRIHASTPQGVSVGDVLTGLYGALRTPVSAAECAEIFADGPVHLASARQAFEARLAHFQSQPSILNGEKAKGLKRVDFMNASRPVFRGLTPVNARNPDVWQLIVS